MKTNSDKRQVTSDQRHWTVQGGNFSTRPAPRAPRHSQKGIALVITLIMLSVTLVMAIAFLAISRRERNAVTTTTDTATARLATDTALAAAQAQVVANILSSGNLGAYDFHLLVSTNYINPLGFDANSSNPTNVNYDYKLNGSGLSLAEQQQNLANLLFLPRAPVFVPQNGTNDFRYFLDLNRNGRFETNGMNPIYSGDPALPYYDTSGNLTNDPSVLPGYIPPTIAAILNAGDPEWVGVLEHPDQPHGPNNKFIARYAFLAQPIGNSLDLNYIHNQAFTKSVANVNNDGFLRNQGVGSWEINLAAFFTDLNTNVWDSTLFGGMYGYLQPGFANAGASFNDAFSFLHYRYNNSYNTLAAANSMLSGANFVFPSDNIDAYSDGPLQIVTTNIDETIPANRDRPALSWVGADNANIFFNLPSELFDTNKNSVVFANRLAAANNGLSTYDRYTFYRMLDQLGTGSQPESKLNLNYDNTDGHGNIVPNAQTNLIAWTPLAFFTNAADRLLRTYTTNWFVANPTNYLETYYGIVPTVPIDSTGYGLTNIPFVGMTNQVPAFGLNNIPVYLNGQFLYSAAVNRLLQLAANIYDATTNSFYPSVFRPMFTRDSFNNVYIAGFTNVTSVVDANDLQVAAPIDVSDFSGAVGANVLLNIYGVPWIIGAKKGLPNFNQFYMLNVVQITRKLQVTKPFFGASYDTFRTNQMYIFSISNSFGVSLWNSYSSNYSGNLTIVTRDVLSMTLTNNFQFTNYPFGSIVTTNFWPGASWQTYPPVNQIDTGSFFVPLNTTAVLLTNSAFYYAPVDFIALSSPIFPGFETNATTPALPEFYLRTTNRLQVFILDRDSAGLTHVVDYVHFAGPNSTRNLNAELGDPSPTDVNGNYYLWCTNPVTASSPNGTPVGVVNQINVSRGFGTPATGGRWERPPNLPNYATTDPNLAARRFFGGFYNINSSQYGRYQWTDGKYYTNKEVAVQAPYTPVRTMYDYTAWQANDPLVHYLVEDLTYSDPGNVGFQRSYNTASIELPSSSGLFDVAHHFQPWGVNTVMANVPNVNVNKYDLAFKDPLMWRPDNWDFPTNPFPSVGWLGRVHRGTPWQTVYMKASDVLKELDANNNNFGTNTWAQWTGDLQSVNNQNFDAANSAPVNDGALFDIFTTALDDNASRGTLSVNQTHLAAWSAVLSGVVALTNATPDNPPLASFTPLINTNLIIDPAGINGSSSLLGQIVTNIATVRSSFTNADGMVGAFEHVGDILRAPMLTEQSPFLHWNDNGMANLPQQQYAISDELYEWLPQQTMGLLRAGSTRYVVYCYGQALRPAPSSILNSGNATVFGMVTNYQVVAESAARAVIRVDNARVKGGAPHIVVESYNALPPD